MIMHTTNTRTCLLNLPAQILGLNLQLLPAGVGVIECPSQLVHLRVRLNDQSLSHLAVLLYIGAVSHRLLKTGPRLLKISFHPRLVFLRLSLVLIDGVDLVAELCHAVVVLLAKSGKSALVRNVGLVQVHFELGQLSLRFHLQVLNGLCHKEVQRLTSRFLFSSIWVLVLEPASSSLNEVLHVQKYQMN